MFLTSVVLNLCEEAECSQMLDFLLLNGKILKCSKFINNYRTTSSSE